MYTKIHFNKIINSLDDKSYLVIGAGLTGAILARRLAEEKNSKVIVIEQRPHIAGNCFDYVDEKTNITVHKYGPHVFHTSNEEVWSYLSKFTQWEPFFYRVKAYIDGNEVGIPFNLDSLYQCFPLNLAQKIESNLLSKFKYGDRVTIGNLLQSEDELLQFLSKFIKEKIFDGYSKKQWGLPIDKLDLSVANRVPVLISRDNRYFQDKYCAIPKKGYTNLIRNILNHNKIYVYTNVKAPSFSDIYNNKYLIKIFNSGSIDEFTNYKLGYLPYRSLDIRFTTYKRSAYQSCAQINYPNDMDFTRSVEYKHYLNEISKYTIISREYPHPFEAGKINERFYPIANNENQALYQKYLNLPYDGINIDFVGRLGSYKYLNMDECADRAINHPL